MRNRLLALTAALGIATFASWTPNAAAAIYCSESFCAVRPESTSCLCPPETDKELNPSTCEAWNSIGVGGCWYE